MARRTLDIRDLIDVDNLAEVIANFWIDWEGKREGKKAEWSELRKYVFAVDTTHTSNNQLSWSNKTTIPKLCQIRDNLNANYLATAFPKRQWVEWEAASKDDNGKGTQKKIKDYILWAVEQPQFKEEARKLIADYIDYGNCFATVEWIDNTTEAKGVIKSGFVGPRPVRINPLDIVFNPTASTFAETPKIIRSTMSIGEAKEVLERMTKTPESREIAEKAFAKCMEARGSVGNYGPADFKSIDTQYAVDGFGSYREYLSSNYVELLTFYGDLYDQHNNVLLKNYMIVVMDRTTIVFKDTHPYPLSEIPIFHSGWRERQDNIWAMGPLDNLVGMQYRLDHIENMKADLYDLTTFPPIKIKGLVGDFEWGPMERIFVDGDGDVELMSPSVNVVQINLEIQRYEQLMEEMAGSPKEAMGFRTPGEKTAYEVQRLENAASRIFQSKVAQFEETLIEPLLNSMLVMAKKYLTPTTIRTIDGTYNTVDFTEIRTTDLSANGRLKPVAARHFAEKAERVQNLNNFFQSALGQDPEIKTHYSSIKLAKMMEELLDITEYELVVPFVRLAEQAEAQKMMNSQMENVMTEAEAPSGMTPDDFSEPAPF